MKPLRYTGYGKRLARLGTCVPTSAFLSDKLTPDERKSLIIQEIQRLHRQNEPLNIPAVKRRHPELLKAVYEIKPFWGWKQALEAAGLDYSKIRTHLQYYVTCQICGMELGNLGSHLKTVHGADKDNYLIDYPGSELMSEELRSRPSYRKNYLVRHWESLWTPEYVLDRIAEIHRRGLPLNTAWLFEHDTLTLDNMFRHFGNKRTALIAVGIDPQKVRLEMRKYPNAKAIISEIQRRAGSQLPLTAGEVALGKHRDVSLVSSARKLFPCWEAALKAAGVDLSALRQARKLAQLRYPTPISVITEIRRRIGAKLPVLFAQMTRGKHSHKDGALFKCGKRHFGSWLAALETAGVNAAEIRRIEMCKRRRYPDEASVIAEIQKRSNVEGSAILSKTGNGKNGYMALHRSSKKLFGSWGAALKAAGVTALKHMRMPMRYPDADAVIAELKRRHAAQLPPPTSKQNNNKHLDQPLYNSARKFFGSFDVALKAAGFDPVKMRQERHLKRCRYQDEKAVIAEIQRRVKVLPHASVSRGKHRDHKLHLTARKFFGSWQAAMKAAGYDFLTEFRLQRQHKRRYPDEKAVIAEIQRRAKVLPHASVFKGKHCDKTLVRNAKMLFGSWQAALTAAGYDLTELRQERYRKRCHYTDEKAVIAEIQRRAKVLPHAAVSMGEHRDYSLNGRAKKLFGSWQAALKAAGFDAAELCRENKRMQRRYPDKDAVIAELKRRRVAQLPLPVSKQDNRKHLDQALYAAARAYFGSWHVALKAAGYDLTELRQEHLRNKRRYPDKKAVIAEIQRRAKVLPHAAVCAGEHRDYALQRNAKKLFGSWQAALKAAGVR